MEAAVQNARMSREPDIGVSLLLILAIGVGGCDSDSAANGAGTTKCPQPMQPPAVVMRGLGGEQVGVHGSFCLMARATGCGICIDRGVMPGEFMVVHPGDEVTFLMQEGALVEGDPCTPACPPTLRIGGPCLRDATADERPLVEDRAWTVDLAPGAYSVWVDSQFEGTVAWDGEIHVGFGLILDGSRAREVIDRESAGVTCAVEGDAG
jgi:hypothetical protein